MSTKQTASQGQNQGDQRNEALRGHYLFAGLDLSQLDTIAAASRFVRLSAAQTLFSQGDPARHFYLVIDGQIKLCLTSRNGAEKIVEVIYAGQTFAEAVAFMTAHRFPVSAIANEATKLLSIPSETYLGVLASSNEACFSLLGDVCRRLHARLADIESLTLQNASFRLVRFFLQRMEPDSPVINLELSRQDIAARLSIKPETLSRIIRTMVDSGIIEVDGKLVTVLDREALSDCEK